MAISRRSKLSADMNTSSMSDLVFLLLLFFMITSTLVSPNAIKLLLPQSESRTMAKQNVTVYINEELNYFIGEQPVDEVSLGDEIAAALQQEPVDATIVLRADKTVPVQNIVVVIDAVNKINDDKGEKHKVILATAPKK